MQKAEPYRKIPTALTINRSQNQGKGKQKLRQLPVWLNDQMFVYEISSCEFNSCCSHNLSYLIAHHLIKNQICLFLMQALTIFYLIRNSKNFLFKSFFIWYHLALSEFFQCFYVYLCISFMYIASNFIFPDVLPDTLRF